MIRVVAYDTFDEEGQVFLVQSVKIVGFDRSVYAMILEWRRDD
jgi:hypothetical protein